MRVQDIGPAAAFCCVLVRDLPPGEVNFLANILSQTLVHKKRRTTA